MAYNQSSGYNADEQGTDEQRAIRLQQIQLVSHMTLQKRNFVQSAHGVDCRKL